MTSRACRNHASGVRPIPRGSDGQYSLPAGTIVNSGDTLYVSQHNPFAADVSAALSDSLSRSGRGGMTAALPMGGNKITGCAPGVDPTDVATVSQLTASTGVPVGSIMDYAGATAPTGWLLCAGQSINRSDYAALFAAIGTTYGSASGSTFNLPDCRGRVSAGVDSNVSGLANRINSIIPAATTLGSTGGAQSVALTTAQLAAHTHSGVAATAGAHTHDVESGGSLGVRTLSPNDIVPYNLGGSTGSAGAHTHTLTIDSAGNGDAHPNVQPTILFLKIIKAVANG